MYQDHGDGSALRMLAQPLNIPTEREAKLQFPMNLCLAGAELVFKSPVKSGYWVPNMVTETLTS